MMFKIFAVCNAVLILAVIAETKPISSEEKLAPCEDCTPGQAISRIKRNAEGILNAIGGLVNNILHENWSHIERIRAMRKANKAIFIGNGHNNENHVWINEDRNDDYYYDKK